MPRVAITKTVEISDLTTLDVPVFFTLSDVVESSGLSRAAVTIAAETGKLPIVAKTGQGRPLFSASAVDDLRAARKAELMAELEKLTDSTDTKAAKNEKPSTNGASAT